MSCKNPQMIVALVLTIALSFLIPGARNAQAQDQGADAAAVVQAYTDAINRGDAVAAAATFDVNAIRVGSGPTGSCSRQSPCIGRAAILDSLQATSIANHYCLTILNQTMSGSVVISRQELRRDLFRAQGIERVVIVVMTSVVDGKITAQYSLNDLSDAQTVAFGEIAAGRQAPGPAIPNPSTPCG